MVVFAEGLFDVVRMLGVLQLVFLKPGFVLLLNLIDFL
jgi:hypothetical protein